MKDGGLLATFIGFLPHRNKYSGVMVLRQISLCNPTNFFFFKKKEKRIYLFLYEWIHCIHAVSTLCIWRFQNTNLWLKWGFCYEYWFKWQRKCCNHYKRSAFDITHHHCGTISSTSIQLMEQIRMNTWCITVCQWSMARPCLTLHVAFVYDCR